MNTENEIRETVLQLRELQRKVAAITEPVAAALFTRSQIFVPGAINLDGETLVIRGIVYGEHGGEVSWDVRLPLSVAAAGPQVIKSYVQEQK